MQTRQRSKEKTHHGHGGDDSTPQQRWDKAMGITKEDDKEAAKNIEAQRQEKEAEMRLSKAHGGLEDWVYLGGNLVTELVETLEEESMGLHDMMTIARQAARRLPEDQWERFQEVPRRCVHALDKEVITTLFSAAEPQWRTLLTTPKKGGTCVFLHIGTGPPSAPILDLLTKLGWFGVCVSPEAPPEGNEDRVQHIKLDPASVEDEENLTRLQVAKGSLLPKPANFMLTFADVIWDADNIDADPAVDQATLFKQIDNNVDANISKKEFKAAQRAGLIPQELNFNKLDMNGDGAISKDEFVQAVKRGLLGENERKFHEQMQSSKTVQPEETKGYGLLGVTWSPQVRWRLRMFRNVISVALQRLANQGSLAITWHGIPNHPALLFITSQLRPVFLRVHVIVPDGTKTWETWILAAGFKRQEAEEVASKGSSGFMFKNFMDNAYRCSDLDDCLLWTLHRQALTDEYRLGGGDRTIAKGFDDLWSSFGQKYRDLVKELGSAPVAEEKDPKPKKKARPLSGVPDAKEPANAKETTKPKSKAKAKPKPKAKDPSSSSSAAAPPSTATADDSADAPEAPEASGTAGVAHSGAAQPAGIAQSSAAHPGASGAAHPGAAHSAAAHSGTAHSGAAKTSLPPVSGAQPKAEEKQQEKKDSRSAARYFGSQGKLPDQVWTEKAEKEKKAAMRKFVTSRSLPNLAGTLGSAPGGKKGSPNVYSMADEWPIVSRALSHLEKHSRVVERITKGDFEYAAEFTKTKKFLESDEGIRCDGVQLVTAGQGLQDIANNKDIPC
jgi:hypothetical protein